MSLGAQGDIFVFNPPMQTLRSWRPFWDCVGILFEFQNSDIDEEHGEWRIQWIAGIALLRAIGHVLGKSDARISSNHSIFIDEVWKRWKSNPDDYKIFYGFIEKERNNILKTYSSEARLSRDSNGFFVEFAEGEDAFALFREAIYWWRLQLINIEGRLSSK